MKKQLIFISFGHDNHYPSKPINGVMQEIIDVRILKEVPTSGLDAEKIENLLLKENSDYFSSRTPILRISINLFLESEKEVFNIFIGSSDGLVRGPAAAKIFHHWVEINYRDPFYKGPPFSNKYINNES